MNPSAEITYQPLSEVTLPDLQQLFFAVFGKRITIEYLRAKYDTKYLGISHIAHFAFSDGKAVAFVGAVPMPFLRDEKSYVGVQFCDYMTLPAYRRKGIHSELVKRNLAMANEKGADFAFAMHTNESLQGDPHIDWQLFEPLKLTVLEVEGNLISKALNRFLPSLFQAASKLKAALKPYLIAEFAQKATALTDTLSVDYSAEYRKYKDFGGSYSIRLPGFEAWIKPRNVIEIGAINLLDGAKFEEGLQILTKAAAKLGYRKIIIPLPANSALNDPLGAKYTAVAGYRPAIIILKEGLEISKLHLNPADFDTF